MAIGKNEVLMVSFLAGKKAARYIKSVRRTTVNKPQKVKSKSFIPIKTPNPVLQTPSKRIDNAASLLKILTAEHKQLVKINWFYADLQNPNLSVCKLCMGKLENVKRYNLTRHFVRCCRRVYPGRSAVDVLESK